MPTGVIINALSIIIGGVFGTLAGHKLDAKFKEELTAIFGLCSMGMGVSSIMLMQNMPAVIFAIVMGTALGYLMHLGRWIEKGAMLMEKPIARIFKKENKNMCQTEFLTNLVTIIVLFCASGTGIYGSLDAGMTGDHTVLISKSILDFFTAAIFACNLGYVVSTIAIPQFLIFFGLFIGSQLILPLASPAMIADFKACGGFLMIATGLRICKIKEFPVADMIPSMILVMPMSWIWVNWILTLLG